MAANGKKAMTKSQLISHLAEKTGFTKKQSSAMLEALAETAYKEAKRGFTIPGIGKLVVRKTKAREGRNPATGQPIKIPAKTVVKLRVSKACKEAIVPPK